MRNILIFYNPHAGRLKKSNPLFFLKDQIEKLGDNYEVISEDPDSLAALPDLNGMPADLVIIVGGDGTVRAVVRLVLESGSDAPVAVIPAGSGNLFAFSLKIPAGIKKSVRMALYGKPAEIDVSLLNGKKPFLISFALGYVTRLIVNTPRSLKKRLGIFAYFLHFLRNIKLRKCRFKISVDGESRTYEANTILAVNILRVFGSRPRCEMSYTDGLLTLIVLANKSVLSFFDAFLYFFFSLNTGKNFTVVQGREIGIHFDEEDPMPASLDGDAVELDSQEALLEMSKKKLRVISIIQ
jgi:YegS/Rv2252/BmrU family lipid kinase